MHTELLLRVVFLVILLIKNKEGKIRLLYEAYPFAYIFKIGGGFSLNEKTNVSLLTTPYPENNCHQKTPIILCSEEEFIMFKNLFKN